MADKKFVMRRENTKNILLTENDVKNILQMGNLDIKINNLAVYQQAFIHRSYLKPTSNYESEKGVVPLQSNCNETFEFLGDSLLNSIVGCYVYERWYSQNEGFLTKTRTKMVRSNTLGEIGKGLNFSKYVIVSQHVEHENGRVNIRILEDIFEAFIAAIYLDNTCIDETLINAELAEIKSLENTAVWTAEQKQRYIQLKSGRNNGYNYCKRFIMSVYERFIDIVALIAYDDNYKDQLQHYYQQTEGVFPTWHTIKEEGKTNNRWHTVGVKDRFGYFIGIGKERKKTDAEQMASKNALIHLGIVQDNQVNYFKPL
jgi:dsRNA-specific ribonuclease